MQKKVTIIGAGSVGATTAFALLTRGAASEVVLIDINTEKALGEALDIKQTVRRCVQVISRRAWGLLLHRTALPTKLCGVGCGMGVG